MQASVQRVAALKMQLDAGVYEVRVIDAAGAVVRGQFEATAAEPPVLDNDLAGLPRGIARALAASRLADADGGSWRLEAYERLAEEGQNNHAARVMAIRLAQGQSLSELQLH